MNTFSPGERKWGQCLGNYLRFLERLLFERGKKTGARFPAVGWARLGRPEGQFEEILLWAGEKNGCLAWPGLSEAGLSEENKMDPPKAGTRFYPLGILFSFPGGNGII